jgi:hypothetical protein
VADALAVVFGDRACALTFKWRTAKAEFVGPSEMRTGHLFNTLLMIWNHSMPSHQHIGSNIRRYRFGPFYSPGYIKEAVREVGRELFNRPDLTAYQREALTKMAEHLGSPDGCPRLGPHWRTTLMALNFNAMLARAKPKPLPWTQAEAIELCTAIETIAPKYGCHVALTGGLLYKSGPRKDADILIYRIRQTAAIDFDGLFASMKLLFGIERGPDYGWCKKASLDGKPIDFFHPEDDTPYRGGSGEVTSDEALDLIS